MPDTNVDIACQREIRRPIEKIKKDRKIPRTVKNENARRKLDAFFHHCAIVVSGRVSFARVRRRSRDFPPRDKEEPARPNADNRFESVSATRDASLWHYKAVHQNGSAVARRPRRRRRRRLGSHGRRCGPFVMPRVEFQRRKATHKRLLAHTRGSPPARLLRVLLGRPPRHSRRVLTGPRGSHTKSREVRPDSARHKEKCLSFIARSAAARRPCKLCVTFGHLVRHQFLSSRPCVFSVKHTRSVELSRD